jgi:hypothetical protein
MKSTAIRWTKKLFAEGSRRKKIVSNDNNTKKNVCVDEMSIPPLQKNNGPSLNQYFIAYKYPYKYQYYLLIFISMRYGNI